MPRPIRLEYKNAYYHVMNRGRGRQTIFPAEQYYQIFQKTLQEAHDRFGLEIHAYCLMSNHYHLLVKTPNANLSRCMRHINGLYTQRHNRVKRTDGPLFRGRYKAILVDKDNYFLRVTRYIHRNPLVTRTPIVKRLVDYPWSSYASYINQAPTQNWLYKTETFELLGGGDKRYQHYVEDHANDLEVIEFYKRSKIPLVLGDQAFKARISKKPWKNATTKKLKQELVKPQTMQVITKKIAVKYQVNPNELRVSIRGQQNLPRQIAIYYCQQNLDVTLQSIADYFGMNHKSAVNQQVRRLKFTMEEDTALREEVEVLCQYLTP